MQQPPPSGPNPNPSAPSQPSASAQPPGGPAPTEQTGATQVPSVAEQPQAIQTADTQGNMGQNLRIAAQSLTLVAQMVAADPNLMPPEDVEVIRNATVAVSRLSERNNAQAAQAAAGAGAVPPPNATPVSQTSPPPTPAGGATSQPVV